MAREDRRKVSKEIRSIVRKGKEAMYGWVVDLKREPSGEEVRAWQAGYLAGLKQRDD